MNEAQHRMIIEAIGGAGHYIAAQAADDAAARQKEIVDRLDRIILALEAIAGQNDQAIEQRAIIIGPKIDVLWRRLDDILAALTPNVSKPIIKKTTKGDR